jgi:pimeloyl-ACP methyl ester carboxylesterase
MEKVISKDGTQIAYDREGQGPALILVDGAIGFRALGFSTGFVKALAPFFTVYDYDRRGRGDSGNTLPFAVEREVEDIAALIQAAGGSAYVCGMSSGACLALEAASRLGDKVKKLALYEAPYRTGPGAREEWQTYRDDLATCLVEGRRGDAIVLFMRFVGTPDEMITGMRQAPVWPLLESVAPTLEYDAAAIGAERTVPVSRAADVTAPTLAMNGSASFPFMDDAAVAIAKAIPHAEHKVLEGQRHDVSPEALAPVLIEFFNKQ